MHVPSLAAENEIEIERATMGVKEACLYALLNGQIFLLKPV